MPVFCSSCGKPMDDTATFCAACGQSRVATAYSTPSAAPVITSAPMADNIAGLLSYLLVPAIVFLLVEPYNRRKFIRFHAFQCIFLCIVIFVINMVLGFVPLLNLFLLPLLGLAELVLWVILAIKAYQGQMFKVPLVGDWAMKQAESSLAV